jgi:hypothetical protein
MLDPLDPWGQEWGPGVSTTSTIPKLVWPPQPRQAVLMSHHKAQPTISSVQPHPLLQILIVPRPSFINQLVKVSTFRFFHLSPSNDTFNLVENKFL